MDFIVYDEASDLTEEQINHLAGSMSISDLHDKKHGDAVEFTCLSRKKLVNEHGDILGWWYTVHPTEEINGLDFTDHDVIINDVVRKCYEFKIEDEEIRIFVKV